VGGGVVAAGVSHPALLGYEKRGVVLKRGRGAVTDWLMVVLLLLLLLLLLLIVLVLLVWREHDRACM
jgi:hypothetical protein